MLRKLLILGVFTGTSASIPIIYQSNPQLVDSLLKSAVASRPAAPDAQPDLSLASAPDKPATLLPLGRKVVVSADARGHFTSQFRFNGRQIDGMIDTGATLVAINTSTARRIGISLNQSDFTQQVNTANGPIKAAVVTLERLQIGKISVDNVQAVVLDDRALQTNLIGMSFLQRLQKYQVENGELLLVQ
ncbi:MULTISPECIES: TIGR02281 family clan AA aspartic protease [unclassified Mesorhizobium]|uniref:TIGR02281 family clan AA aspartic protease n=1 Tax=unclassified Mesorhizobium TaxID=325217 RepID=UPI000BB009AF|nr:MULTISPECIES: TIGR02281 family clan AA aspartic protease [unclassified Mesorhizobium]TGT56528.1 TIGR02281 family clan AA aspartic protease [Mesorhizobium sp. M00.F.Ca.ET.170.01.1.1]AZO11586.1 TIGR02281 family clan AA aspartic protease [Mesorhizobium sp. M3A.F.Ca.ET.080.04.2.1]PBB86791.1 TIGR02281 family clan AA aspartic protease [Mesorhizobium sp. WSM3876]RWB72778.1 MAG: TIGR02281 family clan AA aspartic protease [Mesorhizobium sp.]RWB86948.1 MAG: TIGR02281 family clan AA aspartic protease 